MRKLPLALLALTLAPVLGAGAPGCPPQVDATFALPGLEAPVSVTTDAQGVRHLRAANDLDLMRAQGWVHARDRFFQMDFTRRQVSGDLMELVGAGALNGDVQGRVFGLRRAAARSLAILSASELALLQAYADGVNAWLASHPLPPEYAALELTQARPWTPLDTLAIGKAIAAQLSLDLDLDRTERLAAYVAAGLAGGFDGRALFFEDVFRAAPMDPVSTVPDATGGVPFLAAARAGADPARLAAAGAAAARARERFATAPFFRHALERSESFVGSNEWGVAASHASDGRPMIANDPHLALDIPSTFYELHLVVDDDPASGPMNVTGVGFPGAPGVILGQNEHVTWGATTNPMDVTDIFRDTIVSGDPACPGSICIVSEGQYHVMNGEFTTYQANVPGNGVLDDLAPVPVPIQFSFILTVPFRSHGPLIDVDDFAVLVGGGTTHGLIVQYTGFHATRELQTFLTWNRARNLADFLDGLAGFDFGSQNWAYADADGNLGYFASAELPLRRDLEGGAVLGESPGFVRDGSGGANWVPDPARSQGQSIPYAILPASEMPQALNPVNGFFVNANNDPAGTSLDNDPLNQRRPGNPDAIYYLSPGYANGLRAGRITRLIRARLDAGETLDVGDMKRIQANTQQLDAELMVPFLLAAHAHASEPGAAPELAALAGAPDVQEAVERLARWDFSTPTGIPEGYDAHDVRGLRTPAVGAAEAKASVAATIYNVWRGQLVRAVVDARLAALGVPGAGSGEALVATHHLLARTPFTGVGASGVDFFPGPVGLSPEERRDHALLLALRAALDRLASGAFAAAFAGSTDQDDWRWGRLHRITFDHPLDAAFSVPPQGGFADLAPGLPGLARDGGYEVVNASGFSARAQGTNEFRFGGGPVRRYVGQPNGFAGPGPRIHGHNVVPGGPSGVPGTPLYAVQMGDWLTADYHAVNMSRTPLGTVELLTPTP